MGYNTPFTGSGPSHRVEGNGALRRGTRIVTSPASSPPTVSFGPPPFFFGVATLNGFRFFGAPELSPALAPVFFGGRPRGVLRGLAGLRWHNCPETLDSTAVSRRMGQRIALVASAVSIPFSRLQQPCVWALVPYRTSGKWELHIRVAGCLPRRMHI